MRILFYFSDFGANLARREQNLYGGVGYYRVIKPSQMVRGHDVTVWGIELTKKGETPEERWYRVFKDHDVFWTSYFSDPKEASALFYTRDKLNKEGGNKKVVIDCDDNYLDILESHPLYDKIKATKRDRAFMSTIISFADVVTVSTEPLKQRFIKHFKEVYKMEKKIIVIPNMNDIKDWNYPLTPKNEDKLVIGYAGSNSHQDDLAMFIPELLKIMRKYPNVYFESIGSIDKKMLHLFEHFTSEEMNRCDLLPATHTFKEYPEMMSKLKWDIGVAPLVDSAFARSKTHIKWFDYSMFKIPTIASRVYPYFMNVGERKTIEHDKTGLLVKPSEWYPAMEELILNKEKRVKLGENAFNHIKDTWQYGEDFEQKILSVLQS